MRHLLLLAALVSSALPARAGLLDFLFHHEVEVIVTTDTTPDGALLRIPTKEDPVYYLAVSAGYRDFGGIIAGDKIPEKQAMHRFIAKALAKQGFLPATNKNPPTQMLVFTWGSLYTEKIPNLLNPDMPDIHRNRGQMLRFLGGEKLGLISKHQSIPGYDPLPGLNYLSPNAEMIRDTASEDLYMTAIASYDFQEALRKKPKLLWITRISCPSRGLVMADTLPTMISIATPHIGRETRLPVWINASDKYKADVKVGIPTVDEFLDSGKLPFVDSESLKNQKKK